MLDREADGGPPHGRALDLGTGIWGIELARRGWEVTGVNHVEKALRRAHERISEAGVKKQLLRGGRHAAARGRGRLRLPAAARHRNFHLAHRDDGLAGELGGNALSGSGSPTLAA